eukprot:55802-Eustigmatos_ZCMA.PRE.3
MLIVSCQVPTPCAASNRVIISPQEYVTRVEVVGVVVVVVGGGGGVGEDDECRGFCRGGGGDDDFGRVCGGYGRAGGGGDGSKSLGSASLFYTSKSV